MSRRAILAMVATCAGMAAAPLAPAHAQLPAGLPGPQRVLDAPPPVAAIEDGPGAQDARLGEAAQVRRTRPARRSGAPRTTRVRLAGHLGFTTFAASDTFEAVLGSSTGAVLGGGGGVLIGRHLFVDVQLSRFSADGERVFVTDAREVFPLGIPTTVTVTPIDVSVGWRFTPGPPRPGAPRPGTPRRGTQRPGARPPGGPGFRPVPFGGGGLGTVRYREVSDFAQPGDDVSSAFLSYHVLGGLELPITRRFGAAVEGLYRWVPDALGDAGASAVYGETDLGGATIRVKATVTF
jgi:hypothetical protein